MKRALIAAGGTGGHFYPGLVAALELRRRGWEPLVVVRKDDPAIARLDAEGLPSLPVDLGGLPRRPSPELARFAWRLGGAMRLLSRAARDFKPRLVLGMGGYLGFPAAWAARRRGARSAVHESNAVLGLANAACAKLGAELFWGLPPADGRAGRVVGTPVRPELRSPKDAAASRRALGLDPARPVLLAFGGSQGAAGINAALPGALAGLKGLQVLHLAGRGRAAALQAAYDAKGVAAKALDYLDDMASAYGAADAVVCRSGASTLAELAAQRKPAILVPYPHAAANHQDANARVLEAAGAARRAPEGEGFEARLGAAARELLDSAQTRERMAGAYAKLGLPPAERAAEAFVDALEALAS